MGVITIVVNSYCMKKDAVVKTNMGINIEPGRCTNRDILTLFFFFFFFLCVCGGGGGGGRGEQGLAQLSSKCNTITYTHHLCSIQLKVHGKQYTADLYNLQDIPLYTVLAKIDMYHNYHLLALDTCC